jgi:hypothetical protein
MSKIGTLDTVITNKKNPFDFKNFYVYMYNWFIDNEYLDMYGGTDFYETYYWEIREQVREIWFRWKLIKKTDLSYLSYPFEIVVHVIAMGEKEVVVNGNKINLQDGEIEVTAKAWMEFDEKTFDDVTKNKLFKRWILWKGIKDVVEENKGDLISDFNDFASFVKSFFDITGGSSDELFHPSKGIGY